jgi:hypothetical protein
MSNFQEPYFFLNKNQKKFHKKNQNQNQNYINDNNNNNINSVDKKKDFFNKIFKKIK